MGASCSHPSRKRQVQKVLPVSTDVEAHSPGLVIVGQQSFDKKSSFLENGDNITKVSAEKIVPKENDDETKLFGDSRSQTVDIMSDSSKRINPSDEHDIDDEYDEEFALRTHFLQGSSSHDDCDCPDGAPDDEVHVEDFDATMFSHTAMSLDMDNAELLFNLMYFSDSGASSIGNIVNSALEETVALHSENNTPYKLKPVAENVLTSLPTEVLSEVLDISESDCMVCRDVMEIGQTVTKLPKCKHMFHTECINHWFRMQSWCPYCRTDVDDKKSEAVVAINALEHIDEHMESLESPHHMEAPVVMAEC